MKIFSSFQKQNNPNWSLIISPIQIRKFRINAWVSPASLSCTRCLFHSLIFIFSCLLWSNKRNLNSMFHYAIKGYIKESFSSIKHKKQWMKMFYIGLIGICKKTFSFFFVSKKGLTFNSSLQSFFFFWIKCFSFEILKQFCVLKADKSHFLSSVDVIQCHILAYLKCSFNFLVEKK